jgi:hypothetical protein
MSRAARGSASTTTSAARSRPLADLAVLTKDIMTAPAGEIGGIESMLTMAGGRIVYAGGPYAALEERRPPQ